MITILLSAGILASADNSALGQSDEKTFTNIELGISLKYPSDWTFISSPSDPIEENGLLYSASFCPSSYIGGEQPVLYCETDSPVKAGLAIYKLESDTTLKEFYDQINAQIESVERLVGATDVIETNNTRISGLSAIQTTSTSGGENSGSLGRLLQEAGVETPTSKGYAVYLVNGSTGYRISGGTDDEKDFDKYRPAIEKMINSFQIEGAQENPDNGSFVPETKPTRNEDIVLLSQRLKEGDGDYNDIVGQVKNIGTDTVEFVKIGLTVYDKNGDVVGTESTYTDATTLKPNQKSSFDIMSTKDNFDGMESYELSLQWRGSDGTDEYVDNAQINKEN